MRFIFYLCLYSCLSMLGSSGESIRSGNRFDLLESPSAASSCLDQSGTPMSMLLRVDLQCPRCYRKIKRLLCKFPGIHDQIFDEEKNTVKITVFCCNPERIRQKLICKGCKIIKSIEIIQPPPPLPPKPQPLPPKPQPQPPVQPQPQRHPPQPQARPPSQPPPQPHPRPPPQPQPPPQVQLPLPPPPQPQPQPAPASAPKRPTKTTPTEENPPPPAKPVDVPAPRPPPTPVPEHPPPHGFYCPPYYEDERPAPPPPPPLQTPSFWEMYWPCHCGCGGRGGYCSSREAEIPCTCGCGGHRRYCWNREGEAPCNCGCGGRGYCSSRCDYSEEENPLACSVM